MSSKVEKAFQEARDDVFLTSVEAPVIRKDLLDTVLPALKTIPFFTEWQALKKQAAAPNGISSLLQKDMTPDQYRAFAQIESVYGSLSTASEIIAQRNLHNLSYGKFEYDERARRDGLTDVLTGFKNAGYTAEKMQAMLQEIKIWLTLTPHPTFDRNEQDGAPLYRDLISVVDSLPPSERRLQAMDTLQKMVGTRMTPYKKMNLDDETTKGENDQIVYLRGMLDTMQLWQEALDTVYGKGEIELYDAGFPMDIALRIWYGGDADGKDVPATALFVQRVRAVKIAVDEMQSYFNAPHDESVSKKYQETLQDISEKVSGFMGNIDHIKSLADSSYEFAKYKEQFLDIFKTQRINGEIFENGIAFGKGFMKDVFNTYASPDIDDQTKKVLGRLTGHLNTVGFSIGRLEVRHNSKDFEEIFANLHAHLEANEPAVIKDLIRADISFESMDDSSKATFYARLVKKHGNRIREWLFDSNAQGKGRRVLERFKVVAETYNPKFKGVAIIAESSPLAPVLQQVICDALGIEDYVHVPLNEDEETIRNAARNIRIYSKRFGSRNLKARESNGRSLYLCIMDPRSDSQKNYGPTMKFVQGNTARDVIEQSVNHERAILNKMGSGMAYARGGVSPFSVSRTTLMNTLHTFPDYKAMDAESLDILKRINAFTSLTIQGRDAGMRLATPSQVFDTISTIMMETMGGHAVLDGKISPERIIPMKPHYSYAMENVLRESIKAATDKFKIMRGDQSKEEDRLGRNWLNVYMERISSKHIGVFEDTGARKAARSDSGNQAAQFKPKKTTQQRAIGSNKDFANSETFADGHYSFAAFFQTIQQHYKKGHIGAQDMKDLWKDPEFRQDILPNVLSSMAAADYQWGADILGMSKDGRWTVGDLKDAESKKFKNLGKEKDLCLFHGYLAWDAVLTSAYLNAFAHAQQNNDFSIFSLSERELINRIYKDTDTLDRLQFGDYMTKAYPVLTDMRKAADKTRFMRAIKHKAELDIQAGKLDIGDETVQDLLYHVAGASRQQGPYNMAVLTDKNSFGSRKDHIRNILQTALEDVSGFSNPDYEQDIEFNA